MKKGKFYSPQIGEPVRIIYLHQTSRQEIGVYLRTDPEHYVFSSQSNPGREIFVLRNHTSLEKLTKRELDTIVS